MANIMSAPNPYQPPESASPSKVVTDDRLRISNYNHAGVPLAVAFVIGPTILFGSAWLAWNTTTTSAVVGGNRSEPIAILVFVGLAEIVACIYAIRIPTLWVEIGPTLRYATLWAIRDFAWEDVQRIWIDREDWEGGFGPFTVTYAKHFVLVIQIDDHKDLRVLIPTDRKYLIEAIMRQHPRFKDSPYDDEATDDDDDADE
jgi:hypothetical protein